MEDLSCHYSPKVRQFMSTQTTDVTSRYSTGCNFCPGTPTYQKDDLTATDLKREYSKAMNCIEILKLEKKNLQEALNLTKDFKKDKTEKFFVSSTRSNTAISPRAEFRSFEAERKVMELEQELLEYRRLHDKSLAHNELLRKENYTYKERLQEVDTLQLQNHALKSNLKELSEELKLQTQRNYDLEDEKDQLVERRTQINNSSKKLPPRELYKYLDHVYELIGSLSKKHYAHYQFRECFVDEANIETLIEEKETNQLLVQSFRYITNLLMNINSAAPAVEQRRASNTLFTESGSENQRRNTSNNVASYNNTNYSNQADYVTDEEGDTYAPHPTSNSNVSKNLNFNGMSREIEVEPHSFGESKPLSQQNLSPERYVQNNNNNNNTRGHSPAHSRNMLSNSYSHKANTDINSKRELSRNTSYKSGISATSPKTRDRSPSAKSAKSAAADRNAINVSKQSIARSHVSQRQNTGAETNNQLNASRYSQGGKSAVSHHTANGREAEMNAVNVSRHSQKNYPTHHTTQQNLDGNYVLERSRNITQELGDKEMRLRDLDKELREKDRLLQLREKELKDKSVMERSTARYRVQEEAEVNRSNISQSRKLASQKSMTKDQSLHQSRQRVDDSRMGKSQAQGRSQIDHERSNNNLNKSNSGIQSRIIPSITSLNEMDTSPKAYGASPKHSQNIIKSLSRVAGSTQNVDARSDVYGSPKNFSTVNSQKMLNVISAHDANEVSASYPGNQRISFQDAYMGAHSFDNSPQSKISPKPQTLDRLENSEAKYMDQREYNAQFYDSAPAYSGEYGSPKSDAKRHITFDVRNLGDIEECESPAQSKSLSRKMSAGDSGRKGTEYASFRVSFGRTQSKYMRSQSPDIDAKDSLYIVDVARRKKVTHHEQTYDVVQGNEVKYDLNPMGPDYSVTKGKPRSRYEPQSQNSINQSGHCERNINFTSPRADNTPQK